MPKPRTSPLSVTQSLQSAQLHHRANLETREPTAQDDATTQ